MTAEEVMAKMGDLHMPEWFTSTKEWAVLRLLQGAEEYVFNAICKAHGDDIALQVLQEALDDERIVAMRFAALVGLPEGNQSSCQDIQGFPTGSTTPQA